MRYKCLKLLVMFAGILTLNGCALWTGGIPASYRTQGRYPVIASIHGIRNVAYSDDLTKTTITYTPTNRILLDTGTVHGWLIHIRPVQKRLEGEEFYILPKAARWNRPGPGLISLDQTTCRIHFLVPKGQEYISDDWGMFDDDPTGKYEIAVFLDKKLAGDFKFEVVGQPESPTNLPPNSARRQAETDASP